MCDVEAFVGDSGVSSAWEKEVVNAAVAEIAPVVAQMLEDAIAKRLPWEWNSDR